MKIWTGADYRNSLRALQPKVYLFGERLTNVVDHPAIRPHVNSAAMTYAVACMPECEDLATAKSHLTGETINRFTHIHQNTDDLVKKVKLLRMLGQRTGSCFQRCVGLDALNALYVVTYDMGQAGKPEYHERFRNYLERVQSQNLMLCGAMTDPKGDRGQPPSKQPDPDQYLRVVSQEKDGIVIRGAKLHQTGAVNSHEFIVMPTTALQDNEQDYAVSCAVPVDAEGITMVFGRQSNDMRKIQGDDIDIGNAQFGLVGGEASVFFDDVFVPWERVFMCGETQFAGQLVEMFASWHRQNYGGCKAGIADVIIGATAALADYHGVARASHIRDKVTEMIHLEETLYCCSIACSSEGEPTSSGACYVRPLLANVCKQNVTRSIYEIGRLAQDVAGGFIATLPSQRDLRSPEVGEYVRKYLQAGDVPAEYRIRMGRLIENLTAGTALVESMHGAGSPQAQRIMILRQGNLPDKVRLAKKLAGVPTDK